MIFIYKIDGGFAISTGQYIGSKSWILRTDGTCTYGDDPGEIGHPRVDLAEVRELLDTAIETARKEYVLELYDDLMVWDFTARTRHLEDLKDHFLDLTDLRAQLLTENMRTTTSGEDVIIHDKISGKQYILRLEETTIPRGGEEIFPERALGFILGGT